MRCVVCGNGAGMKALSPELCTADNRLCAECGLVFIPRGAGQGLDYYRDGGYYTQSPNIAARSWLISRHLLLSEARERVRRMETLLPWAVRGKRVLDVGCGYGEIVGYLRHERDCDAVGMEAAAGAAATGERLFGIRIIPALIQEHAFQDETFEVVLCNHTLEHVDDPAAFLGLLKPLVASDGVIYLEVPNVLWPSGGFALENFLYDEHLQTFSAWNLYRLLQRCGFAVQAYSDRDFLRFVCTPRPTANSLEVPPITAAQVEGFLRRYKADFSIISRARVIAGKVGYLAKLALSKAVDALGK